MRTSIPRPSSKRRKLDNDPANDDDNSTIGGDEGPACHSCRMRKAKCSRQQPCSQCVRLSTDCMYDEKKARPGMRKGAIEALNKRLSSLEQMFVGQGILLKPLLERALQDTKAADARIHGVSTAENLSDQVEGLKRTLTDAATSPNLGLESNQDSRTVLAFQESSTLDPQLPQDEVVDELVEWYFDHVHPWIPMLHVRIFRDKLRTSQRREVLTILYAIVSLCLRFKDIPSLGRQEKQDLALRCRHAVILHSMERFSVANLQALVVIAFDIIGSGRGPSAWSVVGSMTRTVEQLRLSVEDEDGQWKKDAQAYLIQRMSFLRESENWVELEERRRVFWNVFLMDRFCSVATGWNNSLTRADVRRRLPCEGALWQAGTPVPTPYFGIAGRPTSASQQVATPTSERHPADDEELESIGGFAFCIEATESLNLVTRFFLEEPLNFNDTQEVQLWLMRFKELDLRLVKWRLFLPLKWRNASVLNQDGIMDPNLTLAHITHNTAVIQLHQNVAYPSPQWQTCPISLPSESSGKTCVVAACEISTIAQEFLQQSSGITSPQFSFCLYIAGQVLLKHSAVHSLPLHPSLEAVIMSLSDVAQRWGGERGSEASTNTTEEPRNIGENLASKFCKRLEQLRAEGLNGQDPTLDIRQPVYSVEIERSRAASVTPNTTLPSQPQYRHAAAHTYEAAPVSQTGCSPDSISLAFPPLPVSFHSTAFIAQQDVAEMGDLQSHFNVDLDAIFDDSYQQMLRVTTFSDDQQASIDSFVKSKPF